MEPVKRDHPVRAHLVNKAIEHVVPIGVHIDVTYRCDLGCVHCYLTDRKRKELTLAEYEALFDDLRALGTLYLLVSGGEIFHRRDGLDILRAARERRFDVRIITHGGNIDDATADALADMDVTAVAMSIYAADAETHDAVTRVRGSFDRTVAGARALVARGVSCGFKLVLMKQNRGVADEVRALADEIGVPIEVSINIKGDNQGSDELLELNVDLDDRVALMDCVYPALVDRDTLPMFSPDERTCLAAHASCYIGPDGTVTPCLDWTEAAGNIRDRPFAEIWQDAPLFRRARLIRRSSFQGCSDCEDYSVCALCPAMSHRDTGDPVAPSPTRCGETAAKVTAFEQSRVRKTG